jgi:hypothetical protein
VPAQTAPLEFCLGPHAAFHWCGNWEEQSGKSRNWARLTTPPATDRAVLLYKKGGMCRNSGVAITYWSAAFNKWHDDGDRLFEYNEFTHFMDLPESPEF